MAFFRASCWHSTKKSKSVIIEGKSYTMISTFRPSTYVKSCKANPRVQLSDHNDVNGHWYTNANITWIIAQAARPPSLLVWHGQSHIEKLLLLCGYYHHLPGKWVTKVRCQKVLCHYTRTGNDIITKVCHQQTISLGTGCWEWSPSRQAIYSPSQLSLSL